MTMAVTKKIDDLCEQAVHDIKVKMQKEYKTKHGFDLNVSFRQASRILGAKYFKRHFGRMPIGDAIKLIEKKNKRRKW